MAVPYFISKNNLSVVYKQWISKLSTQLGVTYKYASGRPYTDPNYEGFQNDRTGNYNDLSFNVSYLTRLFNQYTIVHFSVSNLLGFNNVYGYHFSSTPDENGFYKPYAVTPGSKRFFMLVLMISIE
jgi:vitamin B12 transporter